MLIEEVSWRIHAMQPTVHVVSRRRFLKQTLTGSFALSIGSLFPSAVSTTGISGDVERRLLFFSLHEYSVMSAVAASIVGGPGSGEITAGEVDVALRADEYLAGAEPEIQEQIHQLFTVFDSAFFAFFFDLRCTSFLRMSPEDQSTYLADWMSSRLAFRRTAFQALKRTSLSMFYTDPRSWKGIGYDGMFLPKDRP
jgi:hypothetical protein